MDCRVVVEAAIPVYDVTTPDEAIRIAISKTGEMLNPDLSYVEISMGSRTTPGGEELPPAFVAADEALVALELEMTVFNVEQEEHASRIARKEIGQRLESVPLKVLSVEAIDKSEDTDEETTSDGERSDDETSADNTTEEATSAGSVSGGEDDSDGTDSADDTGSANDTDSADDTDDLIPEFDDLIEDG
ncbi:DUF555 domain-containing protein [Halobellus captivus]|uniref:DUF555 domain-containing protein n=1 Tax=Halobellus captivus TaxID=2592614 RepID=UPI0011A77A6B